MKKPEFLMEVQGVKNSLVSGKHSAADIITAFAFELAVSATSTIVVSGLYSGATKLKNKFFSKKSNED